MINRFNAECARSTSALYDKLHEIQADLLDLDNPVILPERFEHNLTEAKLESAIAETNEFLDSMGVMNEY